MISSHEQISQCLQDELAIAVLHHAAIACQDKVALDDRKGMLDLGTHARLSTVLLPFPFGENTLVARSRTSGSRALPSFLVEARRI